MASHPHSILMVASEAVPFSKTGGLADVAGALPSALARLGHHVTLVTPRYRGTAVSGHPDPATVTLGGRAVGIGLIEQRLEHGATAVLVDCPELYDRDGLYGLGSRDFADNPRRFAVLSRAALEWAVGAGQRVDLVHAHDWQAGLAPVYLKTAYRAHPSLDGAASVFTIHNLAYQGLYPPEWLTELDLGWELFGVNGLEYWGKLSLLKAGIAFSEMVTTVSPTYAREILSEASGFGFEGILAARGDALVGILNGIDTDAWDPARDPNLPEPYGPDRLAGKRAAKRRLLETLGLDAGETALARPLVGLIARMVDQKGFDLIAEASDRLMAFDAGWALLGTGEPRYEAAWRELARLHPDRVGVRLGFDAPLSHLIEAGADLFLMPSRFEPCGLNQMYSQRYGTVPVVRATGGLEDTVSDWDGGEGTGFKFADPTAEAMVAAVGRALATYRDHPGAWRAIQRAGMARDFSWDASARRYEAVYDQAIARAGRLKRIDPPVNQ